MRLPTAEEWERVVRGRTTHNYPWGPEPTGYEAFSDSTDHNAAFIREMWKVGPEWTNSEGWDPNQEERILKGLLAIDSLPGSTGIPHNFFTLLRIPAALERKTPNATFRCLLDREPTFLERLTGWRASSTGAPLVWPTEPAAADKQEES